MKHCLLLLLGVFAAPVFAADALLVGASEPDLAFVRATAFHPFHARFDIPFDEAKSLAGTDLVGRKVVLLAPGSTVGDAGALRSWVERGGTLLAFSSALPPGFMPSAHIVDLGADPTQVPGDLRLVKLAERLAALTEAAQPATVPTKREPWGYTPLGTPAQRPERIEPLAPKRPLPALRHESTPAGAPLTLVESGAARCVVVLPVKPPAALRAAAEALVDAITRIPGVPVPLLDEKDPAARSASAAIVLGLTADAPAEIVKGVRTLPPEGFLLRTRGRVIHIAGSDVGQGGMPLAGTAHGVYDFIERQLGVRWLWPGEIGTVFPRRATLTVPPLDITDAPAFAIRKLRNYGASSGSADGVGQADRVTAGLRAIGRGDLAIYAAKASEATP